MQSTIATTCLVDVSEDMSEIVSLEITFKEQFTKVNKVLSFDTSTNITLDFVFGHASEHIFLYEYIRVPFGEVISLEVSSKKNDVINCTYSDVPLLAKVNLFIRRSELTCSPATYIIYLISLAT